MDISVLTTSHEIDVLTLERTGRAVRFLHGDQLVADVPAVALARHLRRRKKWRCKQVRRHWGDLEIVITPARKVVLRVRGRIGTNTLTSDELAEVLRLMKKAWPLRLRPFL